VIGVRIAQRAPESVAAFVGASQVVNWALQEERSYDWALAAARQKGNAKAEAALLGVGRPVDGQYADGTRSVTIQRRWLGALGGVSADPRFVGLWALSIFTSGSYPLGAKLRYLTAMAASMDLLWPTLCESVDFRRDQPSLPVPVHLFAGAQDRITDLAQIDEWFELLRCPAKRLEVVEDAAHLNLYERPARFLAFMDQVRADLL
jgi:pimeloyl-ACP methyl ester carboxylesterase